MSNENIIEDFINELRELTLTKETLEIINALNDILIERKQDKQRIKELQEENKIYVLNGNNIKLELYIKQNYIPKQKAKDILQKNRNELFSITYVDPKQYEPYEKQIERINKIETELLEGE